MRGRGVADASLVLTQAGESSNLSDLTFIRRVAQWFEQRSYKTTVEGSIPSTPTERRLSLRERTRYFCGAKGDYGIVADKVMHRSFKPNDVGSIPTGPT